MPTFIRTAQAIMDEAERIALIGLLALRPEIGDVIPGTGGLRKLRWAAGGKGNEAVRA